MEWQVAGEATVDLPWNSVSTKRQRYAPWIWFLLTITGHFSLAPGDEFVSRGSKHYRDNACVDLFASSVSRTFWCFLGLERLRHLWWTETSKFRSGLINSLRKLLRWILFRNCVIVEITAYCEGNFQVNCKFNIMKRVKREQIFVWLRCFIFAKWYWTLCRETESSKLISNIYNSQHSHLHIQTNYERKKVIYIIMLFLSIISLICSSVCFNGK